MYKISKSVTKTNEEKVAEKIGVLLSDFHLDLEKVGVYMSRNLPYLVFRRALEVLESAEFQLDVVEQNRIQYNHDRLF
jgi:hypothetical protein